MLINSLISFTQPEHSGYDDLVKARDQFQSIATLINESKRKAENLEEVKKLCQQIHGFPTEMLLSAARVSLLKSGELLHRKKNWRKRKYFYSLFSDLTS
jgi:protein-disulfide isomerase-like protein with CxxC motif